MRRSYRRGPQIEWLRRWWRAWRFPNQLRAQDVPDQRPAGVLVTSTVFAGALLLYFYGILNIAMRGDDASVGSLVVAAVIGLFFVLLLAGLWVGREVARWWLMRLGVAFGVLLVVAGYGLYELDSALGTGDGGQGLLVLLSGVVALAGGLGTLSHDVRAWCAGRYW